MTRLFGELDRPWLEVLRSEVTWRHLRAGETLFHQGDAAESMFIVVTGRFRIIDEGPYTGQRVVGEVGPGETLGEFALLTNDVRSATVCAIRDTDVVELSRTHFERLIHAHPGLILPITRLIVQRAKTASGTAPKHNPSATTMVLVSADPSVCLTDFGGRLTQALGQFGRALHLNSELFDRVFGSQGAAQLPQHHPRDISLMSWLGEEEARHDFVVYQADSTWSAWSQRCARQADRILIVANASSGPTPGALERELARWAEGRPPLRTDVVLLHADRRFVPTGTREWLEPRATTHHHHLVRDSTPDMHRLARVLTQRAVGLVLGGGGARGFAHIGAIRALHEAGIPIDLVGGTSIGSCIAAQCALGLDWRAMLEINRRGFVEMNPMSDYTLPIVALLTTRKLGRVLEMMFGETQIEDLWLGYFCITSNLTQGGPIVHRAGSVRKFVRASMSVPGIAPPVPDNGRFLIDGGVLNNLPVDVMHTQCQSGNVVAVDVSPQVEFTAPADYREDLSGWEIAWRRLDPSRRNWSVPSIASILQRTSSLADSQRAAEVASSDRDLYLHPPTSGFGVFETRALNRLAEIGYRSVCAQIAEWKVGKSF